MAQPIPLHEVGVHETYEAMLARARALVPVLEERAAATERARRPPAETVRDLHDAGLFRILQPRRVGGSEFDYVALVDFPAAVARGDASIAWNLGNLASHHWMLAMFDPATQDEVWADPDVLIASSFIFPAGKAEAVDGGYRLSGRWPFSSGVDPSAWNMLGGLVAREGEAPEQRVFLVPRDDYDIIDTWNAGGLAGTGSNDVVLKAVFVPAAKTVAVAALGGQPTPGSGVNPGALYRVPVFALFPFVLAGAALGNAEAVVDAFVATARGRASRYSGKAVADFQATQIKIASASAKVDAARRIMRGCCIEAMDDVRRERLPDMLARTRYRRDGAYSVHLCTEAVTELFAASGAGALARGAPLERRFRDAYGIAAHIAFSFDAAGSNFGRVSLGLPSENTTL